MRTENLAIVFIDIAGYTPRTSAQTREENLRMLRRFDTVVRPLTRVFNGRVVKTIGDAFLLTFRSPTDAMHCSMAIHDRLVESDKEVDESKRFTIRAAVNAGDVRIENGDVFGEAVNIAARIEGKAGAGEIYFSEAVFLAMTKSEVPHEEVGVAELKGISGKIRLYRVPKATEAGYGDVSAGLPYGGLSLDRVRNKIGTTGAPLDLAAHAQTVFSKLPGVVQQGAQTASRGFDWWRSEVRRSRIIQYVTAALAVLLIFAIVWAMKPKPRKPLTPLQKLQRSLRF